MAEVFFEPVHILGYIDHRIVVGNDLVGRIFAPSRGQRYFTVELIHCAPFEFDPAEVNRSVFRAFEAARDYVLALPLKATREVLVA